MKTPEYQATYDEGRFYYRAGLRVMVDLATMLYRRKGQTRAAKNAQFQRVLALRDRLKEAKE